MWGGLNTSRDNAQPMLGKAATTAIILTCCEGMRPSDMGRSAVAGFHQLSVIGSLAIVVKGARNPRLFYLDRHFAFDIAAIAIDHHAGADATFGRSAQFF